MNFKTEWDLENFFKGYTTLEEIETIKNKTNINSNKLVDKYKNLTDFNTITSQEYLELIENNIFEDLIKTFHYFSFKSSLNTQDKETTRSLTDLSNFFTLQSNRFTFVKTIIKNTSSEGWDRLINLPELQSIRNSIQNIINTKKYNLDSNIESALNTVSNISDNTIRFYDEFTGSFEFSIDGVKYNKSQVYAMMDSQDSDTRKKAIDSLREVYTQKQNRLTIGNIYQTVLNNSANSHKLRGFETAMTYANLDEELNDATVNNLISKVKSEFYPLNHRFLALKAKNLGKDKLDYYDTVAPYISTKTEQTKYSFETGLNIYLESIKEFDQEFYEHSKYLFENGCVDVFPNDIKKAGAFCASDKNRDSLVLLNWTDTFGDITVLAHELGHAIHGHLCKVQPKSVYRYTTSVAETASIFNETLLFDTLINKIEDQEEINTRVFERLDDIFGTAARQIMYTSFENRVHSLAREKTLNCDDFDQIWFEEQSEYLGSNVNVDKTVHSHGWSMIPHIYRTPFYCYSYSFGLILSLSLYGKYLNETVKQNFIKEYKEILSSGGSVRPKELLSKYNIDIDSDQFYRNAQTHIEELLNKIQL